MAPTSVSLAPQRPSGRLRRRLAVVALGAGALLAAGCSASAPPPASVSGTTHLVAHHTKATSSTTTTTLAPCGSTRDPLDPTNSPPPAGSVAICPP